jgi:hypothetical protein
VRSKICPALLHLLQVGALLMLVMYIYSYMGVLLFGTMKQGEGLSEHANFTNFPMALLALFRLATNDNWNDLLAVCCAPATCLSRSRLAAA